MEGVAASTRCAGESSGCLRRITAFIVSLDEPGLGVHVLPPLTLTAVCSRHERTVLDAVRRESVEWLQPAVIAPSQVGEILSWFHGASGLCTGAEV